MHLVLSVGPLWPGLCRAGMGCAGTGKRGMGTECVHCSDELSQSDRAARCLKCNKLGHYPRCVRGYCRGCARQPPAGASRVEPKPCRLRQEGHTGTHVGVPSTVKKVRRGAWLLCAW